MSKKSNAPKSSLSSIQAKVASFQKQRFEKGFNKNYGTQAKVAAMHSIQRASGRRGN